MFFLQLQQTKALSTEQLKIQMTIQSGASHRLILSYKITSPLSTKRSNPTTHRILHLAIPLPSFYQLLNIHLDRELELKFYKILMSNLIVVLFQISNMQIHQNVTCHLGGETPRRATQHPVMCESPYHSTHNNFRNPSKESVNRIVQNLPITQCLHSGDTDCAVGGQFHTKKGLFILL